MKSLDPENNEMTCAWLKWNMMKLHDLICPNKIFQELRVDWNRLMILKRWNYDFMVRCYIYFKFHGSVCWVAGYGAQDGRDAYIFGTKKSIGLYYLNRFYCNQYRKCWKYRLTHNQLRKLIKKLITAYLKLKFSYYWIHNFKSCISKKYSVE